MKPSHFMTDQKPAVTGLLEFDMLAVQAFLKINRVEFEKHCEILSIPKEDSNRIIEGLYDTI